MKIYILGREYEFDNNKDYIEDIVKVIYRDSNKKGYSFAYVVIDGVDIYSNFREYIESNIKNIRTIKVVSMTFREMTLNSIVSIKDYIEEEKMNIPMLIKALRNESEEESLRGLDIFLEGMSWIIEYFNSIDNVHNLNHIITDYYVWNEYARDIYVLGEIVENLEDYSLDKKNYKVAEILQSKVMPLLNEMLEKLTKLAIEE